MKTPKCPHRAHVGCHIGPIFVRFSLNHQHPKAVVVLTADPIRASEKMFVLQGRFSPKNAPASTDIGFVVEWRSQQPKKVRTGGEWISVKIDGFVGYDVFFVKDS